MHHTMEENLLTVKGNVIDVVQIKNGLVDKESYHDLPDTSKIDLIIFKSLPSSIGTRKLAEIKIFEVLLLNAWRKRRDDAVTLKRRIITVEKSMSKFKTQCEIAQKLFITQCKKTEKQSAEIIGLQNELDKLSKTLEHNLNEKELLGEELKKKQDANLELKENLDKAEEKFLAITESMDLLNQKLSEVENFQLVLTTENKKLINENEQLKEEQMKREQQFTITFMMYGNLLQRKQDENYVLLKDVDVLKLEVLRLAEMIQINDNQKKIIDVLTNDVNELQNQIESTVTRRFRKLSHHGFVILLEMCRQFANYLLPAFPFACAETPKVMLNPGRKIVQPVISVKTFAY